jgi:hypothetical protein
VPIWALRKAQATSDKKASNTTKDTIMTHLGTLFPGGAFFSISSSIVTSTIDY